MRPRQFKKKTTLVKSTGFKEESRADMDQSETKMSTDYLLNLVKGVKDFPDEILLEANKKQGDSSGENSGHSSQIDFLDFTGKSLLPNLTDLINKNIRIDDRNVLRVLLDLFKYAQHLENIQKFKNKEIQRLEYLNKFLVIAQKKRDEMLTHTLEENRKLKELALLYERMLSDKKKQKLPPITQPKAALNTGRGDPMKKSSVPSIMMTADPFSSSNDYQKKINNKMMNEKKTAHTILKLNEQEALVMLHENENLKFLNTVMKNEDKFADSISNMDKQAIIQLYDSVKNLNADYESLFKIIIRLKKIFKAASVMSSSLDIAESMEKIVEATCECLGCTRATVFLLDSAKEELWSKVAKGSDITIRIPWNKGVAGYVATKGELVNIPDAYQDDRFDKAWDLKSGFKTKTILATPILNQGKDVSGVLQSINKEIKEEDGDVDHTFTKEDEGLIQILANLAGVVLKNSLKFDQQLLFHNTLRLILRVLPIPFGPD